MSDIEPIDFEFNWNSKQFMDEFQKFLKGGKEGDAVLEKLRDRFSKITKEQAGATSEGKELTKTIKEIGDSISNAKFDDFGINKENLEIQRQIIVDLKNQIIDYQKQISESSDVNLNESLINDIKRLEVELAEEKKAFAEVEAAYKKNQDSQNDLNKGYKDVTTSVNEMSDAVKNHPFDDFGIDKENIQIQKQIIKELEQQVKDLYKEIGKKAPGIVQARMIDDVKELEKELAAEKDALSEVELAYERNKTVQKSLQAQYEDTIRQLRALAAAGQGESDLYNELKEKAVEYQEAIKSVNNEISAGNSSSLSAFVKLLSLISSGMSVAEGTTALFSSGNENLERIMLRVQSLMAITIGLQEIHNTLMARDAASTRLLIGIKNLWVAANTRVTASLVALGIAEGAATVAAQVLIGTLTLGLSVAIGALIVWYDKWESAQAKASEEQKKMSKATADAAADQMIAYKKLQIQWNSLADDLKSKEKFINGNQDAFKKLGIEVSNVSDAENFLVKNTEAFVASMMARAEATASMQIAQEKFKEYLITLDEENDKLSNPTIGAGVASWFNNKVFGETVEEEIIKAHEGSEELRKEYEERISDAVDYEKKKDEIYKKYGFKEFLGKETKTKKEKDLSEIFDIGSVLRIQQQIMLLDGALQRMGKNGEVRLRAVDKFGKQYATNEVVSLRTAMNQRAILAEQLAEAEKLIRLKKLTETISQMESDWQNYYRYEKDFGTEAAKSQFSEARGAAMSYYEWLGNQRDKLTSIVDNGGILTDEQVKGLGIIQEKLRSLTGEQTEFELFSEKTELQLQQIPTIADQIEYLTAEANKLSNVDVDKGFYAFLSQNLTQKQQELRMMVVEFINTHQSFEAQKLLITDKYAKLREAIEKRTGLGTDEKNGLLAELQRELQEELAMITSAKFQREHLENELSANLLNISTSALRNRIATLKEFLATEISLTKGQRDKLNAELKRAEGLVDLSQSSRYEKDLQEQKADLLRDINSLKSKGNELTVVENQLIVELLEKLGLVNMQLKNATALKAQKISDAAAQLGSGFSEMASAIGDSNEGLSSTLETMGDLANVASSAAGSVASFASGDIIGGITGVMKTISGIFSIGKKARESERKAQEEIKKRQAEQLQAQLDYNAALRQRMVDEVRMNDLYKSRVDNIKEEIAARSKAMQQNLKEQQQLFNKLLNMTTVVGQHTDKYGGFLGIGRKTKVVDEKNTIANLLGLGNGASAFTSVFERMGNLPFFKKLMSGDSPFKNLIPPDTVMITDEMFDKLEKLNAQHPLTGDAKTAYEQLKKLRDEYGSFEEANRQLEIQLKNAITGTTAQSLADSIREGLKSGKKSFADFADDIEGFLREAILAGISAKMIEPKIQELQDALAEMMGDGILSADERAKFQQMYMAIVNQSSEYMDLINQAGVNMTTGGANPNSLSGALKAASQESIDLLSGHTMGMRLAQLETNQILRSGGAQMLEKTSQMIEIQIDIEKNTRRTADNTEKLHDVNDNVEKVVTGQDKYYKSLQAAGIIK